MKRSAGILMPVASLAGPYGIGTIGEPARRFIRFLESAGQSYWQILPIGPTGFGNSPYQSFSSFAGNPYLIDLGDLVKGGYLEAGEDRKGSWGDDPYRINYGLLYRERYGVLRKAVARLKKKEPADYRQFLADQAYWLEDYALFMAEKTAHGGRAFSTWEEDLRQRQEKTLDEERKRWQEEMNFYKGVQYLFFQQWQAMLEYAHEHGVRMIGDVPIYVSPDSSDLWANPHLFKTSGGGKLVHVAGCPPDAFSIEGQFWGNPLYDWKVMKDENYAWWIRRIAHQFRLIDVLRIDHFRGFESYYVISAEEETAADGFWQKGPGMDFFRAVEEKLGKLNIIAEDLGFLTDEVVQMVRETGYPGMKVLEFAFDPRDTGGNYLPYQYPRNCVVYIGTHDNDPIMGWMKNAPEAYTNFARRYLHLDAEEGYNWGFIRAAYASVANLAIIQLQDILGLDSRARINTPSTIENNWEWRCEEKDLDYALARKLQAWVKMYGRQ